MDKVLDKVARVDVLYARGHGVGWAGKFEDWFLESWESKIGH